MTKTGTGTSAIPTTTTTTTIQLTPAQLQHLNELKGELALEKQTATPAQLPALEQQQRARLTVFYEQCRRANADANSNNNNNSSTALTTTIATGMMMLSDQQLDGAGGASQDSNSPAFQAQLQAALQDFWSASLQQVCALRNQTEQDFKTHNDLPLARIKRIMKSDEGVFVCVCVCSCVLRRSKSWGQLLDVLF